ncbi:MAG: hypothetical protein O6920_06465 [Chloroflexi bacterium]|nr:hypothetical protein [Chloroflexota bacterium]
MANSHQILNRHGRGRDINIVESYPPQVYLAPYPGMDAKIALAAPGRLEVLDNFDEQRIREFIGKNLTK